MRNRNITIGDVARLAGVSNATVSRALQKPDVVSEKTREKVNAAVLETGYTQNVMARNLRLDRTGMVVALVPDISNPFFSEILSGIESVATREGYNVLIANTNNDPAREHIYASYVQSNLADGILLLNGHVPVPNGAQKIIGDMSNLPPMVALCERIPNVDLPTVVIDNVDAARLATQHLIEMGHTNIVHVAGPIDNILTKDRRDGFLSALENAGLAQNLSDIFYGDFTINSGKKAFGKINQKEDIPTAIFCANDEIAMGVISAAREAGFSVPDDISVVGFDDIEIAEHYYPTLTTIHQPRRQLGVVAMEQLVELISSADAKIADLTTLGSQLIIRKSVKKVE